MDALIGQGADMGFEFTTQAVGDELIFRLAGELDLAGRDVLADAIIASLEGSTIVVVDLTDLAFIDSSGLSALLRCRHSAIALDRRFGVRGAIGAVANVLDLTGIGTLLSDPADLRAHADSSQDGRRDSRTSRPWPA